MQIDEILQKYKTLLENAEHSLDVLPNGLNFGAPFHD
jgi:hypothetical protein